MTEYTPTVANNYGYVPPYDVNWDMFEHGVVQNKAVAYLILEFEYHTKNVIGYRAACDYWIHNLGIQGIKGTEDDIRTAYTACYGHGAEFEWEYA